MTTHAMQRKGRGRSSSFLLLVLAVGTVFVSSQPEELQQAQCMALLTASYPSSSSSSLAHAETCLRLADLFVPSSLAPPDQPAPLLQQQQQWQQMEEHHLRFPSSSSSSSFPFSFSFAWPHIEATGGDYATFKDPEDIVNLCVAFACVLCAAMAAGLTIGLMVRKRDIQRKG